MLWLRLGLVPCWEMLFFINFRMHLETPVIHTTLTSMIMIIRIHILMVTITLHPQIKVMHTLYKIYRSA